MPYFIKRGDKVQGPIGHEQLMSLASQNRLKQSDWISVSKDGPYQKLAVAWDFIKHSDQNWTKPTSEDSTGSHLHKKTTDLKAIFVAVFEDIANPSNKAKYISISSTIAGLFAFLFLSFTFISALFSIAGIIFGCVSILRFEKYRTLGYVGVGFSCLAFMCLINNTANNAAIEKRRNEIAQAKLAEGKKLNQEEAEARLAIYESNKPRIKAEQEKAEDDKSMEDFKALLGVKKETEESDDFVDIELRLVSRAKTAIKEIDPTASFGWIAADNFRWIRATDSNKKGGFYYVGKAEGTVEIFGSKVPRHWHVELEKLGQTWTVVRCEVNF